MIFFQRLLYTTLVVLGVMSAVCLRSSEEFVIKKKEPKVTTSTLKEACFEHFFIGMKKIPGQLLDIAAIQEQGIDSGLLMADGSFFDGKSKQELATMAADLEKFSHLGDAINELYKEQIKILESCQKKAKN